MFSILSIFLKGETLIAFETFTLLMNFLKRRWKDLKWKMKRAKRVETLKLFS